VKRVVAFVHAYTPAKICLQLGHSGPKGSTKVMWEGMDEPLDEGNWPVVGPSARKCGHRHQMPRSLARPEMDAIREQFVTATRMAERAGFDMVELHCAHGYLLSTPKPGQDVCRKDGNACSGSNTGERLLRSGSPCAKP